MNPTRVYADTMPAILIPILLVALFGVIVIIVILLKKHVKIFKSDEKPKSDKEIAAEELDRLLEPVEDLKPAEKEEGEEVQKDDTPNPWAAFTSTFLFARAFALIAISPKSFTNRTGPNPI